MPRRKIGDIVGARAVLSTSGKASVREAAQQMVEAHIGAMPVVDDGVLVGIFTERDALASVVAGTRDPATTRVEEVMTRNPVVISPQRTLAYALHLMHGGGYRHMPVVDNGQLVGMISARDALGAELIAFEHELAEFESVAISL